MVVFRLTQEEYTSLRDACRSKGGRNLSEFTRTELLAMLRAESLAVLLQKRFLEVEQKIVQLESAVLQVTRMLAGSPQATAPNGRRTPGMD